MVAMLARYTIVRGKRPPDQPLPDGVRLDTRRHTRHCLRPKRDIVDAYLADPSEASWRTFRQAYLREIQLRYAADPAPFDQLAELAAREDVYLGCSCPTKKNPDVHRCHTVLALGFMRERYPQLKITMPD